MSNELSDLEKEALRELKECGNMVYNKSYTPAEKALMRILQKKGLVELAWVPTSKGKEVNHYKENYE